MKKIFLGVLASVFLFTATAVATETYKIGVLAKRGPVKALQQWKSTGDYLNEKIAGKTFEIVPLDFNDVNPAIQNNICYTYVAEDVFHAGRQEQDDKEDIMVLLKPIEEVPDLIRQGFITHALVLTAFYRYFMEYRAR